MDNTSGSAGGCGRTAPDPEKRPPSSQAGAATLDRGETGHSLAGINEDEIESTHPAGPGVGGD